MVEMTNDMSSKIKASENANKAMTAKLEETNAICAKLREENERLQRLLAGAQTSILTMTGTVSTNQNLPAVSETVTRFETLFDQQRQIASQKLRRWLRKNKNEWPKDYALQKVHELMFKLLIASYREVLDFQETMFKDIIEALNMERTMEANADDEKGNDIGLQGGSDWFAQSKGIISKRFKDYFKTNYETILDREKVTGDVWQRLRSGKNSDYLKVLSDDAEEMKALRQYVNECCDICWIMVLQESPLGLDPMEWAAKGEQYKESEHMLFKGSDTGTPEQSHTVKYYVWPVITQKGDVLEHQKKRVMVRDSMSVDELDL